MVEGSPLGRLHGRVGDLHARQQHAVAVEAERPGRQTLKGADEQSSEDHEHQREPDLQNDETT